MGTLGITNLLLGVLAFVAASVGASEGQRSYTHVVLEQYPSPAHKILDLLGLEEPLGREDLEELLGAIRSSCRSQPTNPTATLKPSDLFQVYSRNKAGTLDAAAIKNICTAVLSCQMDPTCALEGAPLSPAAAGSESNEVTMLLRGMVAVGLFFEALLGIYIPVWLKNLDGYEWWLSLLNCFSGGVFLAAGLVHLLPHCQEAQASLGPLWGEYPLYLVLITIGYLLVLFVERVAFDVHGAGHHHPPHTGIMTRSQSGALVSCSLLGEPCEEPDCEQHTHQLGSGAKGPAADVTADGGHQSVTGHDHGELEASGDGLREPLLQQDSNQGPHSHHQHHHQPAAAAAGGQGCSSSGGGGGCGHHHHHPQGPGGMHQGLVLLGAMSIHTALECMALGLMSARKEFFMLVIAIASHKLISGLALSSRFLKEGATTRQITMYVGPFVFVAPISIFVGVFVRNVDPVVNLALCCFATGTFIYVGASEIVEEEFEGDMRSGRTDISVLQARYIKFLMLLLGVGSIALLSMIPDMHDHGSGVGSHAHSHGHHHHHHH